MENVHCWREKKATKWWKTHQRRHRSQRRWVMQPHKNLAACRHLGNGGIIALIAVFKKREKDLKTVAVCCCSLDISLSVLLRNSANAEECGRHASVAVFWPLTWFSPLVCKLPLVAPCVTFFNKLSLSLHLLHVHTVTRMTSLVSQLAAFSLFYILLYTPKTGPRLFILKKNNNKT